MGNETNFNEVTVGPLTDDLESGQLEDYLGIDKQKATFLAYGADSIVLRLNKTPYIAKVYGPINDRYPDLHREIPIIDSMSLQRYKKLLDYVDMCLKSETSHANELEADITLSCNPIEEISISEKDGVPVAISKAVEGNNLEELYGLDDEHIQGLLGPNIDLEKLKRIYGQIHDVLQSLVKQKEFAYPDLGEPLWPSIGPDNVKVFRSEDGKIVFMLTDLFKVVGREMRHKFAPID